MLQMVPGDMHLLGWSSWVCMVMSSPTMLVMLMVGDATRSGLEEWREMGDELAIDGSEWRVAPMRV